MGSMHRESTFQPQATQGHVLCCLCGATILPNSSNMCVSCLRTQVDITAGIQKQATILWCKECGRYLQPPKHWLRAEPESKELLTYCLKKLKGLQKVKLVDAGFIWTEPHSRRLKVKISVQAEVFSGAILQQSFVVEYVVETNMCPDCEKQNSNQNVWVAAVQRLRWRGRSTSVAAHEEGLAGSSKIGEAAFAVFEVRQHTEHKRTFLYLEQLILKHGADTSCLGIKNIHEGIDFHFANRAHAQKFVDFLQSVVPVRFRQDKQLVSHNIHTSSYNYKYTFSVEIVPICKDDLVCLPHKLATALGNISPLLLCTRVTNVLSLTDLATLRTVTIDSAGFWRQPFRPLMQSRQLEECVVLDVEPQGTSAGRHTLADAQVAKSADFGSNDRQFSARTHLGHLFHAGDTALAYDLTTAQLADPDLEKSLDKGLVLPDMILVRKSYEEKRRRRKARGHQRPWVLKRLVAVQEEEPSNGRGKGRQGLSGARDDADQERFLEELEEDAQLRSKIALYKRGGAPGSAAMEEGSDDEGVPAVPLEELLDDLSAMQLADSDMSD